MKALIVYYSKTGHTLEAANDIARGLEEAKVEVTIRPAAEVSASDVADFDIFLAGSPTYGNTRYKAPAKAVEKMLDSLKPSGLSGKYAGAFSVMAGYGADKIVQAMESQLADLGATVVAQGPTIKAGAPLSLWKGPSAGKADVTKCTEFGRRVADAAK